MEQSSYQNIGYETNFRARWGPRIRNRLEFKMYRYIEPEVAGSLGDETIINTTVHPPFVSQLHFVFNGWLGDDILETFPCYIISERLKNEILNSNLIGIAFKSLKVTKSIQFKDLYPNLNLPDFYWAIINGKYDTDDFVISEDFRLIVSENAFKVLSLFNVSNAIFENYY